MAQLPSGCVLGAALEGGAKYRSLGPEAAHSFPPMLKDPSFKGPHDGGACFLFLVFQGGGRHSRGGSQGKPSPPFPLTPFLSLAILQLSWQVLVLPSPLCPLLL